MEKILNIIIFNINYYGKVLKYFIAIAKEYIIENERIVPKVSLSLMTGTAVLSLVFIIGNFNLGSDNMNYDDREVYAYDSLSDKLKENVNEIDESRTEKDNNSNKVKVRKASVNDKGDPQKNKRGGASVDISSLITGESNKDFSSVKGNEHINNFTTYGVDVSKWQGKIDWKKVKESGVDFAMIRVGYRSLSGGGLYEDPYAKYNLQQATANDIKVGVYFFSTAISKEEVLEEARWVTQFIEPYSITYPVAYDCEGYDNRNYRHYNLTKNERTDLAIVFLDYVKSKGYSPMFYNSSSHLNNNSQWNTSKLNEKCKIWVAQWVDNFIPSSRALYNGPHDMWQYTARGKVPGIKGDVDLNVAYFGYNNERASAPTNIQIRPDTRKAVQTVKPITNLTVTRKEVPSELAKEKAENMIEKEEIEGIVKPEEYEETEDIVKSEESEETSESKETEETQETEETAKPEEPERSEEPEDTEDTEDTE